MNRGMRINVDDKSKVILITKQTNEESLNTKWEKKTGIADQVVQISGDSNKLQMERLMKKKHCIQKVDQIYHQISNGTVDKKEITEVTVHVFYMTVLSTHITVWDKNLSLIHI